MYLPEDAIKKIQKYIDNGAIDYDMLDSTSKSMFKPRAQTISAPEPAVNPNLNLDDISRAFEAQDASMGAALVMPVPPRAPELTPGQAAGTIGMGLSKGLAQIGALATDVVAFPYDNFKNIINPRNPTIPGSRTRQFTEDWKDFAKPIEEKYGLNDTGVERFVGGTAELIPSIGVSKGLTQALGMLPKIEGTAQVGKAAIQAKNFTGSKLAGEAAEQLIKNAPDTLNTWLMMEAPKKSEDRTPLASWALQDAAGLLAVKGIGAGIKAGIGKVKGSNIKAPDITPDSVPDRLSGSLPEFVDDGKDIFFDYMDDAADKQILRNASLPFYPKGMEPNNPLLTGMRDQYRGLQAPELPLVKPKTESIVAPGLPKIKPPDFTVDPMGKAMGIDTPLPIARIPGHDYTPNTALGNRRTFKMPDEIISRSERARKGINGSGAFNYRGEKIPMGKKERGFSRNTRTDLNNPDNLRDSFAQESLIYEQLANKETLQKAQSIFNEGFETARSRMSELASKMQPEAIPLAKLLSRHAAENGNMEASREIIAEVAEKLTQAGQFGQAARILREADPETLFMTLNKQLKKLNEEGSKIYGRKWNDVSLNPNEINMIDRLERGNQQAYEQVFEQIQKRIANQLPSTGMEKINAWRHMSMLLNPKTQVRNVGGNALMWTMRRTAKQVSAVVQSVALPKEHRTQVFKVNPEYKNVAERYFEANKKDLLGRTNKFNENITLNMPDKRVFQNRALENTRQFTYKLLEMGDAPFFKNAYVNRLASYAQAKGIKDFADLPQDAFDTALKEAEEATYKDASEIASFLNKLKNPGPDASLGGKVRAGITEAVLPFTKTPINVIKRGIQYGPVGIINGLARVKSKETAAKAIDEMAKGLTGTGVMGLGYLLASKGVLTGKAEDDPDLRAYDANTGNSPFSILGRYTYDWAQPFSVPLSVGVEIWNAVKESPQDAAKMESAAVNNSPQWMQICQKMSAAIYDSLAASGDTVFNMSVLKGVKSMIANPQGIMAGIADLPKDYIGQLIPTLSGQLAGAIDPTVRQTYVKDDWGGSLKNTMLNKIPFASMTLPAKQTPWGTDIKRIENPASRAFSQFLSPGIISVKQDIDPQVDAELRRLNASTGRSNQFPTLVDNYIPKTTLHPRVNLTPSETHNYQQRVGELTLQNFNKLVTKTPRATKNKTADEVKVDLLAEAISEAKAQAQKEILKSKGYKYQ